MPSDLLPLQELHVQLLKVRSLLFLFSLSVIAIVHEKQNREGRENALGG